MAAANSPCHLVAAGRRGVGSLLPESASPADAVRPSNFIAAVAQKVGPAVVRIDATRTVASPIDPELFNQPLFRRFFGGQIPQLPQEFQQEGTGSGFIIDANGLILTNAHVVEGSERVRVHLLDGRTFEGEVKGSDPVTDIAVIQIEGENLPTVTLGNSDQVRPGIGPSPSATRWAWTTP